MDTERILQRVVARTSVGAVAIDPDGRAWQLRESGWTGRLFWSPVGSGIELTPADYEERYGIPEVVWEPNVDR